MTYRLPEGRGLEITGLHLGRGIRGEEYLTESAEGVRVRPVVWNRSM
jgi:hypothetical protein